MNTTLYIYTLKTAAFKQKYPKNNSFKMAAKLPIFVSRHFDFGKNLKNNFSKGTFFNEIWLIIGDYEYINIAEIRFGYFHFGGILRAKHFFPHPLMLD